MIINKANNYPIVEKHYGQFDVITEFAKSEVFENKKDESKLIASLPTKQITKRSRCQITLNMAC